MTHPIHEHTVRIRGEHGVVAMGTTADEEDADDADETRDPPGAHSMQRTDVAAKGTPVKNPLDGATHTSRDPGRTEPLPLPSHQPSSSSLSSDHQRSAAPILLTLKPSKPLRPHDRSDVTTTDAEEDENKTRHTPTAAPARGTPRLVSEKKKRERRAHAPIPGDTPQTFAHLVLPHALVPRAPSSGMYFYRLPSQGFPPPKALRAHTGTLVGNNLYIIGGCDKYGCWPGVAVFNTETHMWRTLQTGGDVAFPPLRAHTTTLVGKTLYVVGGGDGPHYSNDVYAFDTLTHTWRKPAITSPTRPPPRRAHTTVLYAHRYLVLFAGGNGHAALNDVWACDVANPYALTWYEWRAAPGGDVPVCKGYHTANLVGEKMVVYGGSDGVSSFADVHVLDIPSMVWTRVQTNLQIPRLSHTATQVGSYLFVIGGHDGQKYAQDVLLFNLVTLEWETKPIHGVPPAGRGYHITVLHDSRLIISGGYDGHTHFGDLHALELASCAYLPQVTAFEVDEKSARAIPDEPADAVPPQPSRI